MTECRWSHKEFSTTAFQEGNASDLTKFFKYQLLKNPYSVIKTLYFGSNILDDIKAVYDHDMN
jgi:hypothetical protein